MDSLKELDPRGIDALLLDLDDTLLVNDMDTFLPEYLALLARHAQSLIDPERFTAALLGSTRAMMQSTDGQSSNAEVFWQTFLEMTGLAREPIEAHFHRFYLGEYESLSSRTRPVPGAPTLIDAALARGLQVIIATNPVFPRAAIDARLRWAGVNRDVPLALITTYEVMHWTKPHDAYFAEIGARVGCAPERMLMVGNDPQADIAGARAAGLHTHLVTSASKVDPRETQAVLEPILDWLA